RLRRARVASPDSFDVVGLLVSALARHLDRNRAEVEALFADKTWKERDATTVERVQFALGREDDARETVATMRAAIDAADGKAHQARTPVEKLPAEERYFLGLRDWTTFKDLAPAKRRSPYHLAQAEKALRAELLDRPWEGRDALESLWKDAWWPGS